MTQPLPQAPEVSVSDGQLAASVAVVRQAVATRMQLRLDELAQAMLSVLRDEIPAYAAIDDAATLEELLQIYRGNLAAVLRALAQNAPLDAEAVALQRGIGRRSAVLGFPLHATMRAYHVGANVTWPVFFEELAELSVPGPVANAAVAQMTLRVVDLVGELSGTFSDAYLEAEGELAAAAHRLRRDVFDELLSGPFTSIEPLRARAERAGYRLGEAHLVVIVSWRDRPCGGGEPSEASSDAAQVADALRGARAGDGRTLAEARGEEVIAIVPTPPAGGETELHRAVEQALDSTPWRAAGCLLGLGQVERGMAGIPRSYRQALLAVDAARALGRTGRAMSYAEVLPYLVLMRDPGLGTDIWEATVGPLVRFDADHGRHLVETLSVYLEERGNVVAAAKRLYMHRHTLTARLELIESLSGRSLKRSDDLLLFELGLRAHRLPGTQHRHEPARRP